METVLITGASGFIGSHLCDKYLEEGYKVIAVDNLITGNEKNISHLKNNNNFKFIKHDIIKPFDIEEKLDLILHFASPASPIDYLEHPQETLKVNSYGTFNILELVRKNDCRYIVSSTSETYGDPLIHPQPEYYWGNVNPIGPRSVYDEAKRFSEAASMSYYRTYGSDIRILRLFNTYGPRMKVNDGRVVPNFIDQALNGKNLTVQGDGEQTRSFCYVSDLVEGVSKVSTKQNISGELFNLGCPDEFKIIDFAKLILELIDTKSKIIYTKLPVDDPKVRQPDINKAKEILKWKPKVSLEKGLLKTINYFEKNK